MHRNFIDDREETSTYFYPLRAFSLAKKHPSLLIGWNFQQ